MVLLKAIKIVACSYKYAYHFYFCSNINHIFVARCNGRILHDKLKPMHLSAQQENLNWLQFGEHLGCKSIALTPILYLQTVKVLARKGLVIVTFTKYICVVNSNDLVKI